MISGLVLLNVLEKEILDMSGFFARLLPLVCLCALLAGCGGEKTEPTQAVVETTAAAVTETTENITQPETTEAPETEPVTEATEAAVAETQAVLSADDPGTARETKRRLECAGLLRQGAGEVIFENSSGDAKMIELCKKLLGGAV